MIRLAPRFLLVNICICISKHLLFIAKTLRDADRLDALKPTKVKNDVTGEFSTKSGELNLSSSRFRTRIMMTSSSQVGTSSLSY